MNVNYRVNKFEDYTLKVNYHLVYHFYVGEETPTKHVSIFCIIIWVFSFCFSSNYQKTVKLLLANSVKYLTFKTTQKKDNSKKKWAKCIGKKNTLKRIRRRRKNIPGKII